MPERIAAPGCTAAPATTGEKAVLQEVAPSIVAGGQLTLNNSVIEGNQAIGGVGGAGGRGGAGAAGAANHLGAHGWTGGNGGRAVAPTVAASSSRTVPSS